MGDIECDDCGEQPYLSSLTHDYEEYHDFDGEPDVEIWCECPTDVPVVFDDTYSFHRMVPDCWGQEASRYVCYKCGQIPVMRTSANDGGTHLNITYHLSCRCDGTKVGFSLRGTMPDEWKDDMDPTKWPDITDEILDAVEEYGPMSEKKVANWVDADPRAVECFVIRMRRENELFESGQIVMTADQLIESDGYEMDMVHDRAIVTEVEDDSNGAAGGRRGIIGRIKELISS